MTSQSTLGPLTTLILSLTVSDERAAQLTESAPAGVVTSFLFAQFLTDILSTRARRNARRGPRVFRIGNAQDCQTSC
jgi:hypothetical protein